MIAGKTYLDGTKEKVPGGRLVAGFANFTVVDSHKARSK